MTRFKRGIGLAVAGLAFALAAPASAQENLDSGKTGAQLYAADCAICHKTPQALKRSGGLLGLSSFLREHYTASRESAAAISSYLDSLGGPPSKRAGASKRTAKDDKTKGDEKKAKPKSGNAKSESPDKSAKPADAKTSEPKSESKSESKSDSKGEAKTEPNTEIMTEPKSEPKPPRAKTGDAKPAAKPAKPDKPDKPEKSD